MVNPVIFLLFGITSYSSNLVQGGSVTADASITAVFNSTVFLTWRINIDNDQVLSSFNLFVLPDEVNTVLAGNAVQPVQAVAPRGTTLFEDRLSATYNITQKLYTAKLKNVKYNEKKTFKLEVSFRNPREDKYAAIEITDVTGSPRYCGKTLNSTYTVKENDTLTVVLDICGHPKPDVKWKVGEGNFSSLTKSTEINNATRQYSYIFNTQALTRTDCGNTLTFTALNTEGSIDRHAKIYVEFTPFPVVITASKRLNKSCVFVSWNKKETGNCVIDYHLQFNTKMAIFNTTETNFTLCNLPNASYVIVWASHRENISKKVNSSIEETQPTTTTQTTITSKATSDTKTRKVITNSGDDNSIGLIIGIVGGILFVIIVVIIVVCVLKHKKKNGTGNHSGYAMRVTGEENNYVTDPTHPNRRQPANPDDPEQAIYSELGPGGGRTGPRPAPEQSDYAEMKVDAMGYPIDGAKASEPPTYAPIIKPREGAKRRTPSPPRNNVDGARAAASSEPPTYAPVIKNRSSSRGRSPPPDEDDHEGVIV